MKKISSYSSLIVNNNAKKIKLYILQTYGMIECNTQIAFLNIKFDDLRLTYIHIIVNRTIFSVIWRKYFKTKKNSLLLQLIKKKLT